MEYEADDVNNYYDDDDENEECDEDGCNVDLLRLREGTIVGRSRGGSSSDGEDDDDDDDESGVSPKEV